MTIKDSQLSESNLEQHYKTVMKLNISNLMLGDVVLKDGELHKIGPADFANSTAVEFEAVPLTKELMLNNGWSPSDGWFACDDDDRVSMYCREGNYVDLHVENWRRGPNNIHDLHIMDDQDAGVGVMCIKYVHQLQQLTKLLGMSSEFKI